MKMNNKSKLFIEITETAKKNLRNLLRIPNNFTILFFQGSPSTQYSAICYNLLGDGENKKANYLATGKASLAAQNEAAKYCTINQVASNKQSEYKTLRNDWNVINGANFFHYCESESV